MSSSRDFAFSRRCSASAILPSCCCKRLFFIHKPSCGFLIKGFHCFCGYTVEHFSEFCVDLGDLHLKVNAVILASFTLQAHADVQLQHLQHLSVSGCRFMIAAITALCRMLSSTVGEFRQYFFPKSRRLMHRHTIFFLAARRPCAFKLCPLFFINGQ